MGCLRDMLTLALAFALAGMPTTDDLEPPAAALTGPSSTRLALPVAIRFDETLTDDVSKLISKDDGSSGGASREPVWAVARFAPGVARRHFEDAKWWSVKAYERVLVVKSVSVAWSPGPNYEVKVVVDRYEGDHRIGQATGSGWGRPDRTGERTGAAFAGPWAAAVHNDANQPKAQDDGNTLRQATVAALDNAFYQLAAVWSGEQMVAKARADAEAMMQKAQQDAKKKKK